MVETAWRQCVIPGGATVWYKKEEAENVELQRSDSMVETAWRQYVIAGGATVW